MIPVIGTLAEALASTGFTVLKDVVDACTDDGLERVQQFVEDKTGLNIRDANISHMSTEDMEKIQKCVLENQIALKQLALKRDKAVMADISNARQMQIETLKAPNATWFTSNFVHLLGLLVVILPQLIVAYGLYFAGELSPEKQRILDHFEQSSDQLMNIVVIFYFGSTFKHWTNKKNNKDD